MKHRILFTFLILCLLATYSSAQRRWRRQAFTTDTLMVHDPVMAYEDGKFYIFSTGMGIQMATSTDLHTWSVQPRGALTTIPAWAADSVPGFRGHVWAPDIIHYNGRWWMTYSCSTFGRNTSAIGIASSPTLDFTDSLRCVWQDHGAIVCSKGHRDDWNAIDSNIAIDDSDTPWLTWGSFWDGIQLVRLDPFTMHIAEGCKPKTIARRVAIADTLSAEPNPTSRFAGRNAIEAPFIFSHAGYYYLFVSHDYCCRGMQSNYKVAVGRSRNIEGPYLDANGRDMSNGGGTLVIEGDKKEFEATGHSAAYHLNSQQDIFICHGYSVKHGGQAILVKKVIEWTPDGWPTLKDF